jgi:hypothetical protein
LYEFSLQARFSPGVCFGFGLFRDRQCGQRSKVTAGKPQIGDSFVIASSVRLFSQSFGQSHDRGCLCHRSLPSALHAPKTPRWIATDFLLIVWLLFDISLLVV